jgi:hypothetical protein
VFFIPVYTRGAHVMVCDEICLNAVRDRLPLDGALLLTTSVVCARSRPLRDQHSSPKQRSRLSYRGGLGPPAAAAMRDLAVWRR